MINHYFNKKIFIIPVFIILTVIKGYAQDTISQQEELNASIKAANDYIQHRTSSLTQYTKHVSRIQRRLLHKISRVEHKLTKTTREASAKTIAPKSHNIDYDSLLTSMQNSTKSNTQKQSKPNARIDSLKDIQSFIHNQRITLQRLGNVADTKYLSSDYSEQFQKLQNKLSAQQQLQNLILKRTKSIESLFVDKNFHAVYGLKKHFSIAKSKIKNWKDVANKPDEIEKKAYEYLLGVKGFSQHLQSNDKILGKSSNQLSIVELKRMGYQTKEMVKNAIQKQFGDNLNKLKQQIGREIKVHQQQLNHIKTGVEGVKSIYVNANNITKNLKRHQSSVFHNPLRGVPFILRWHTRYDFRTTRAIDNQPAVLQLSASMAYQQTPKLKMGYGLSAFVGLGKDWQHFHLSYQGISLRGFVDYNIIFGIAFEVCYEYIFKPFKSSDLKMRKATFEGREHQVDFLSQAFGRQQQIAYLGLMKSYRINKKWNGTFMVGYNFLWQHYGMHAPIIIRIGWEK